jgi:2-polyprenyl-3-methyl-5-hydroxy-6-metoxy-1,4-benzoquinol methylase
MIAKKDLPAHYRQWNRRWGAPYGYRVTGALEHAGRFADPDPARYGPFGFQYTSATRIAEYPWAFHTADLKPGMRVLDVGGWLSGFQVVLADAGCEVVNVDPSACDDPRWTMTHGVEAADAAEKHHRTFIDLFDADVTLVQKRLQDAGLADGSFDRIFAISVLEHVDQAQAAEMVSAMRRLLVPGGLALLTVDLFLELKPFGMLTSNHWGGNLDVRRLVADSGLELASGDPAELLGYPEFDPAGIIDRIDELFKSPLYPVVSQLIVLRRPG